MIESNSLTNSLGPGHSETETFAMIIPDNMTDTVDERTWAAFNQRSMDKIHRSISRLDYLFLPPSVLLSFYEQNPILCCIYKYHVYNIMNFLLWIMYNVHIKFKKNLFETVVRGYIRDYGSSNGKPLNTYILLYMKSKLDLLGRPTTAYVSPCCPKIPIFAFLGDFLSSTDPIIILYLFSC
jgi:hypothetical protein